MTSPKISVIIPVYNTEKYLRRCLDSILTQTYTDWECLLIDDGSTDKSGDICDEYSSKDSRIVVIHQSNQGVISARKNGVNIARGEWITFVDSDDILPKNALRHYMDGIGEKDTDIIIGYNDLSINTSNSFNSIDEYRLSVLLRKNIEVAPWGKLIRKSLINDWIFALPRNIKTGEDWIMNIRLSFQTQTIPLILAERVYIYNPNETGATISTKMTSEHEHLFYKYVIQSIPSAERTKYNKDLIRIGINSITELSKRTPLDLNLLDSKFFLEIRESVKQSSIHLSLKEWTLLYCRIARVRWFVIKASNFINRNFIHQTTL